MKFPVLSAVCTPRAEGVNSYILFMQHFAWADQENFAVYKSDITLWPGHYLIVIPRFV